MKLSEAVKPVSYVKAHASEIIRQVGDEGGAPVVITQNGEARAVLMGIEQYERMQESLAMLRILAMSGRDVEEGRLTPAAEAFGAARARRARRGQERG
ncbi:MAG: type II toxin-antitoxin system Phd/YefM family antitoxin [Desulfovibrionaceae bacterium]